MPHSHHAHSGQFCRHAKDTLAAVVDEAARKGFKVFGLTEHAPRYRVEDLYPEEVSGRVDGGWMRGGTGFFEFTERELELGMLKEMGMGTRVTVFPLPPSLQPSRTMSTITPSTPRPLPLSPRTALEISEGNTNALSPT
jgi:histidinol-phosphatase (PHP family)